MSSLRRIAFELKELKKDPPYGCSADPINNKNLHHWKGYVTGLEDSPFEGGIFKLDIVFPKDYPFKPPKVKFITKIYHPGVNKRGQHCLDVLGQMWSPALSISTVLLTLSSFIVDVKISADDPMDPKIANVYKTNRKQFNKTAREWVMKYADFSPKLGPSEKELESMQKDEVERLEFLIEEMRSGEYWLKNVEKSGYFFRLSCDVWESGDFHVFSTFMFFGSRNV